jgi:hypothetical protein
VAATASNDQISLRLAQSRNLETDPLLFVEVGPSDFCWGWLVGFVLVLERGGEIICPFGSELETSCLRVEAFVAAE